MINTLILILGLVFVAIVVHKIHKFFNKNKEEQTTEEETEEVDENDEERQTEEDKTN